MDAYQGGSAITSFIIEDGYISECLIYAVEPYWIVGKGEMQFNDDENCLFYVDIEWDSYIVRYEFYATNDLELLSMKAYDVGDAYSPLNDIEFSGQYDVYKTNSFDDLADLAKEIKDYYNNGYSKRTMLENLIFQGAERYYTDAELDV